MEITISNELWARIKQKVDDGSYPSVEVVLTNAMIHLYDHDEFAAAVTDTPEVQAMIEEAEEALRNGDYTTYTKETSPKLVEEIIRRGRERREARNRWLVG